MNNAIGIQKWLNGFWVFVFVIFSTLVSRMVFANEEIAIIVNEQNKQLLTQQDVKNIYDDIITHWDNGELITVLNLPADSVNREIFSSKIFDARSWQMVAAETNRSINNTIRNPSVTRRERWVAKVVSKNPNAIGYVPVSLLPKVQNVRVIMQID